MRVSQGLFSVRTMHTSSLSRLLACWCVWFAILHFAWALGWRWGVPIGQAPIVERPFFLAYDLAAGVVILAAAVIAGWVSLEEDALRRRGLARLIFVGSLVAGLRGTLGLLGDADIILSGSQVPMVSALADLWFLVAGTLGAVLWLRHRREMLIFHQGQDDLVEELPVMS